MVDGVCSGGSRLFGRMLHGLLRRRLLSVSKIPNERGNIMQSSKPGVMLGGVHISKAVSDDAFFRTMPEFASIRAQMATMHIDIHSKKGCTPCNKRRMHANIDGNFAAIAASLPDERAKVLKKYLGLDEDQPFYIRAVNPATRKLIMKTF